ncbi:DUF1804 family protein [Nitrosospira sp. NpAV]|uniref:DUF1804 family protein n=1 Tax=Nitrosospira sp. NpAV TaxID=58133 RepID=UPI00059F72E5|nr:DUF1804 family protein [Nitrosospira sp. NpAV]KIO49608.1 hypothetical protein SQ11_05665 [Nitrosospira sp. NpAV]
MAHPQEKITAARAAYVYEALTLEAIAQKCNVSKGTLARWKKTAQDGGDDWDRARAAARLSGQGAEAVTQAVLEDFVLLFQSTLTEVKTDKDIKPLAKAEVISRLSDAYNKTMSAVSKGNPKLNKLAVAMEVLQVLAAFIQRHYPRHANAFGEILEPFGEEVAKSYG